MPRYKLERGADGKDFVLVGGTPVGVVARSKHGKATTCTIEGERTRGANGECVIGDRPEWAVKRAKGSGLVGAKAPADLLAFEAAKTERDRLEADVKAADHVLAAFPRGAMGLTPDAVKVTPEYQAARRTFQDRFARLQKFNTTFVRRFVKEIRAEQAARRGAKLSGTPRKRQDPDEIIQTTSGPMTRAGYKAERAMERQNNAVSREMRREAAADRKRGLGAANIVYQTSDGHVTIEQTGKSKSYVVWINEGVAAVRKGTFGVTVSNAFQRAKDKLDAER